MTAVPVKALLFCLGEIPYKKPRLIWMNMHINIK